MDALTVFFSHSWLIETGFQCGFWLLFAGVAVHTFSAALSRVVIGGGASLIVLFVLSMLITSSTTSVASEPTVEPVQLLQETDEETDIAAVN